MITFISCRDCFGRRYTRIRNTHRNSCYRGSKDIRRDAGPVPPVSPTRPPLGVFLCVFLCVFLRVCLHVGRDAGPVPPVSPTRPPLCVCVCACVRVCFYDVFPFSPTLPQLCVCVCVCVFMMSLQYRLHVLTLVCV